MRMIKIVNCNGSKKYSGMNGSEKIFIDLRIRMPFLNIRKI